MPSIYTHECFGIQVAEHLPDELKDIVKKYPAPFHIGLQGPDFLFFYHPLLKLNVNRLGYRQHRTPAKDILLPLQPILAEKGKDSPEYAYMIGFICHFMLDSECHGYVNEKAKEKGFNHLVMEMEFDRYLIEGDGEKPLCYPLCELVPRDELTIRTVSNIYKSYGITEKQVREALNGMYFYKKLFTTGRTFKRALIRFLMKLTLHYRLLEGHMMDLKAKKSSQVTNKVLLSLYEEAIPKAVVIIQKFNESMFHNAILDERFSCDFRSNEIPGSE